MITARAEDGKAILEEDGKLVLKAYASPDGAMLRIVLPELRGYGQVRHFVEGEVKYLQFQRRKRK